MSNYTFSTPCNKKKAWCLYGNGEGEGWIDRLMDGLKPIGSMRDDDDIRILKLRGVGYGNE